MNSAFPIASVQLIVMKIETRAVHAGRKPEDGSNAVHH
jgi:hypothetical protein